MVRKPLTLALLALGSVAGLALVGSTLLTASSVEGFAAVPASAPPAERAPASLERSQSSLRETLQTDLLARRLDLMREKLDLFGSDLVILRGDAVRLTRRADAVRQRRERDGFLLFDLGKFKDDVWRRRLWMQDRRREAERLKNDAVPDKKLLPRAQAAVLSAERAESGLVEFDLAAADLLTSIQSADPGLIGSSAVWEAATARSEAHGLLDQLFIVRSALEHARDKTSSK